MDLTEDNMSYSRPRRTLLCLPVIRARSEAYIRNHGQTPDGISVTLEIADLLVLLP
jgi:hypothetical protein